MTAWREGSETGPKLNFGMSNQFFERDAMEESVFVDTFPKVKIFCLLRENRHFPQKMPKPSASANRRERERERERERAFIREGNRAPVAKATHARCREGPVRPRMRR